MFFIIWYLKYLLQTSEQPKPQVKRSRKIFNFVIFFWRTFLGAVFKEKIDSNEIQMSSFHLENKWN